MKTILLILLYISCFIFSYGTTITYVSKDFPKLPFNRVDYLVAIVLSLAGPLSVAALCVVSVIIYSVEGHSLLHYGWTLDPTRERRIQEVEDKLDRI